MSDIVRVLRTIEYIGPREWIEATLMKSYATSDGKELGRGATIREIHRSPIHDVLDAVASESETGLEIVKGGE